jgi:hypothetical protein
MSAINLQINFVDGTTDKVLVVAIDQIRFESNFNISIAKLGTEMMLTHLYWMAWQVQHRTKKTALEFEVWAESVDSVEVNDSPK